ncbi:MAG TPA: flagellar biosynthesis protein FlhF [Thiotrichales bacterium]|nr:flagellar biosynthesis protein FlhF [Thiotrichales bacterium]
MKMKRYFAADARTALRELREEQGPDAVILSNRKVSGGVEIIAALDYEDALLNTSLGNPDALTGEQSQAVSAPAAGKRKTGRQDVAAATALKQPSAGPEVQAETQSEVQSAESNVNTTAFGRSRNGDRSAAEVESSSWEQAIAADGDFSLTGFDRRQSPGADSNELEKIQDELKGLRNIMEAPLMQFSWGEMERIQPLHASLLRQLMALGLSAPLCEQIASALVAKGLHKHSWLEALKMLAAMLPVADEDLMRDGGVVSLIGPTGVGKTTTIAKLAARFALRHGRRNIALVTTDSYRIGAHEQLRTYGRILGVPVQVAADSDELQAVLNHCSDKKLILIDTSGVSQHDQRLAEQLATLSSVESLPIRNYLVLSATGQMNLQQDIIRAFGQVELNGCFLTKVDEAASLGEVFSVLIEQKLPMAYVSDGQKVPDDLHPARGQLLVKEAVKLMQKTNRTPSDKELAFMFGGMINNANT